MPTYRPYSPVLHYGRCAAGALALRGVLARGGPQMARRANTVVAARLRQRRRSRRSMDALIAGPGGKLAWKRIPAPRLPEPHGAIVHPLAIATCDMDPLIALGATPFPLPIHMGHECVAEVVAVGAEVASVRTGQRVVVPFQISCGGCRACRAGCTSNCESVAPASMYGFGLTGGLWGGALADELAVPFADAMLVPLPDGVEPVAAASLADNVVDAYRHVAPHLPELAGRGEPPRVLILGAPRRRHRFSASLPLYTGLIAQALGAEEVLVCDARTHVREHAARLGLSALAPTELTASHSAPLVVDATAMRDGLARAIRHTRPDGICSSAGGLHARARLPMFHTYATNVTVHIGRVHARTMIPRVLELMTDGRLRPETVTTVVAGIEDAPAALSEHYRSGGVKTIITA